LEYDPFLFPDFNSNFQVILNPAPAAKLPDTAYRNINTLIVNSNEAELLCDMRPDSLAHSSPAILTSACELLIRKGVKTVIITLGSRGAIYQTESGLRSRQNGILLPAIPCQVVDTTAAGDTFVGAYAVRVAAGTTEELRTEEEVVGRAVEFAIQASAKTVQKRGAQSAIPYLEEIIPGRPELG
jgi:ribokinase